MAKYKNIYESWKKNPINFWKNLSKDIDWNTKPSKILDDIGDEVFKKKYNNLNKIHITNPSKILDYVGYEVFKKCNNIKKIHFANSSEILKHTGHQVSKKCNNYKKKSILDN